MQAVTDALGNTTSYGYDANGNLTTVTDPQQGLVRFDDAKGTGPVAGGICELGAFLYSSYDTYSTYRDTVALGDSLAALQDQLDNVNNRISNCEDDDTRLKLEELRERLQKQLFNALQDGLPDLSNPVHGFAVDLLTSSTVCGIVALLPGF